MKGTYSFNNCRGAKVLYSPYTPRRHGTYNIYSNLQKRQTCQIHDSCHVHCVHLSVFLGITLRFISSTLGDIVNVNREADMVSTFFFLDNESLFLFGVGSCNRRWQLVMRMLGMMQLSCGGEYISNIHLRLSNRVVYHVYTTRRPFDVSVSYGIYMYICHDEATLQSL